MRLKDGVLVEHWDVLKYTTAVTKLETAWANLEDVAAGLPLPARFTEAVAKAKRAEKGGIASRRRIIGPSHPPRRELSSGFL